MVDVVGFAVLCAASIALAIALTRSERYVPATILAIVLGVVVAALVPFTRDLSDRPALLVFSTLKAASVFAALALAFSTVLRRRYPGTLVAILVATLVINCTQAAVTSAFVGNLENTLIGFAMMLMIPASITIYAQTQRLDAFGYPAVWQLSRWWILLYTFWDMSFIVAVAKTFPVIPIGIGLVLPVLLTWRHPERYVLVRTALLAGFLTVLQIAYLAFGEEAVVGFAFFVAIPAWLPMVDMLNVLSLVCLVALLVDTARGKAPLPVIASAFRGRTIAPPAA